MKIVNCVFCQKKINTKVDDYYKVELFGQGTKKGTAYSHVVCYHQKDNNENKLMGLANELMQSVKNLGIIPENKEFEVVGVA